MRYTVDSDTGCWNWNHYKKPSGYGTYWNGKKTVNAHKHYYEQANGPVPAGLQLCHKCNNPSCVNPDHMYVGTAKENASDKVKSNRCYRPIGSKNGMSKLTEHDVEIIREMYRRHPSGKKQRTGLSTFLSSWFGITSSTVSMIKYKKRWK
jgi:hypothetical protein